VASSRGCERGVQQRSTVPATVPFAVRASRVVGTVILTDIGEDACDSDAVGTLRLDSESVTVQVCDGNGWLSLGDDGILGTLHDWQRRIRAKHAGSVPRGDVV
jgi:hypothetical protein